MSVFECVAHLPDVHLCVSGAAHAAVSEEESAGGYEAQWQESSSLV